MCRERAPAPSRSPESPTAEPLDTPVTDRRRLLLALLALSVEGGCAERAEPPSPQTTIPCMPSRCSTTACALRGWPEPVPKETGFCLTASLDKVRFRVEEPILVTLVLENISGQTLSCGTHGASAELDYIPYCRDGRGLEVPATCHGERVAFNRGKLRFGVLELTAGAHAVHQIQLTRLVDLSEAGKYTLKVARAHLDEPTTLSNTCSFEVVDG